VANFLKTVACCMPMQQGSKQMPAPVAMMPGLTLDRYTLLSLLGRGNMGEVWRAQHSVTHADCAIKVLHADLARHEKVASMFVQEAQVGARLNKHPNVAYVTDAGIDATTGIAFLVMELLEGHNLEDLRTQQGPLPIELFRVILNQLGSAIDAAHRANIVHRDLKPGNLFLETDYQGQPLLKVLDYGISRVLEQSVARTATLAGTPAYAAPEQLGPMYRALAEEKGIQIAKDVSCATDIWALGLIAYDLLTGAESGDFWQVSSAGEIPLAVVLEPAPKPSQRAGAHAHLLPEGFDIWFQKCVERDAQHRWPSFVEATSELARLIDLCPWHSSGTRAVIWTAAAKDISEKSWPADLPESTQSEPEHHVESKSSAAATLIEVSTATAVVSTGTAANTFSAASAPRQRRKLPVIAFAAISVTASVVVLAVGLWPHRGDLTVVVAGPDNARVDAVQIFVDHRKECDVAPCVVHHLNSGFAHIVSVSAPGFVTPAAQPVRVRAGHDLVLNVTLTRSPTTSSADHVAAAEPLSPLNAGISLSGVIVPAETLAPASPVDSVQNGLRIAKPGSSASKHLNRSADDSAQNNVNSEPLRSPAPNAARMVSDATESRQASGQGTLNVNSIPVSNAILDGRPLGSTPKLNLSVAAGAHTVVFVHPEYGRKVVAVTVEAGQTAIAATRFP
jgi:serine/threonine protein kinase